MVVIKLSTVFIFVLLGFMFVNGSNWSPFIPENTGHFGEFGWSGKFLTRLGVGLFCLCGLRYGGNAGSRRKNPQKDLPKGILGSLGICTLAYIVVALVLTGVVSESLNVPDPMAVALNANGPSFFWVASLVKFAILAGLASVV